MRTSFKRCVIALMLVFACNALYAQTETVTHIVERGETLGSIAQKYNVTTEAIVELNPEAAQFVYIGMELLIPIKKSEAVITQPSALTPVATQTPNSQNQRKAVNSEDDFKHWVPAFQTGYGILHKPKGVKGTWFSYNMTLGFNYFIDHSVYTGIRIGYNSSSQDNYSTKTKTNYHYVSIPVEVGYKLSVGNSPIAIAPYGGFDLNFCVKEKVKKGSGSDATKKSVDAAKGEVAAAARLGLRITCYGGGIGVAYVFHINDNQKNFFSEKPYPEINLGFSF